MAVTRGNPPLQAVNGGGRPRKPRNVKSAAARSRRDLLVALRDEIASAIDGGVPARDLSSLSRRLLEIARDIEAIDSERGGDEVGDAAATPDEPFFAG
jgi:hypothetical protein